MAHSVSRASFIAGKETVYHLRTLDWLNENTGEDQAFFGVEIKLVRIDTSRPAPFNPGVQL
ncbi:hypothetical protein [Neomoorella mulderi]|uniref:hypothetical protein n=1 Tax=Neomoorella mulderi TaxID=202604 RepID=UPI00128FEEBF|nr:hypothetical protein [Moorella mulderi]